MVDEVVAFTISCCVCGYHANQRMWTVFIVEITITNTIRNPERQVITIQNTDINVHAAHCAALALSQIPKDIIIRP